MDKNTLSLDPSAGKLTVSLRESKIRNDERPWGRTVHTVTREGNPTERESTNRTTERKDTGSGGSPWRTDASYHMRGTFTEYNEKYPDVMMLVLRQ